MLLNSRKGLIIYGPVFLMLGMMEACRKGPENTAIQDNAFVGVGAILIINAAIETIVASTQE